MFVSLMRCSIVVHTRHYENISYETEHGNAFHLRIRLIASANSCRNTECINLSVRGFLGPSTPPHSTLFSIHDLLSPNH
jgi:hypothetical protein